MLYKFRVGCMLYKRVVCVLYFLSYMIFSFLNCFFSDFSKQKANGSRLMWASSWHFRTVSACCINMSYACCIFVLHFSRKKNNLITIKRKLEEPWLGLGSGLGLGLGLGLFFVLYFCVLYFSCCIFSWYIYSLDSELTLTMQNIDVRHETTAQLRADKKEH